MKKLFALKPRRGRRTTRVPARELGHIRLAPPIHARNPMLAGRAQPQYPKGIQAGQAGSSAFL